MPGEVLGATGVVAVLGADGLQESWPLLVWAALIPVVAVAALLWSRYSIVPFPEGRLRITAFEHGFLIESEHAEPLWLEQGELEAVVDKGQDGAPGASVLRWKTANGRNRSLLVVDFTRPAALWHVARGALGKPSADRSRLKFGSVVVLLSLAPVAVGALCVGMTWTGGDSGPEIGQETRYDLDLLTNCPPTAYDDAPAYEGPGPHVPRVSVDGEPLDGAAAGFTAQGWPEAADFPSLTVCGRTQEPRFVMHCAARLNEAGDIVGGGYGLFVTDVEFQVTATGTGEVVDEFAISGAEECLPGDERNYESHAEDGIADDVLHEPDLSLLAERIGHLVEP